MNPENKPGRVMAEGALAGAGLSQSNKFGDVERIHCLNEMGGKVYVTTSKGLYRVDGDKLTRIAFPD